MEFLLAVNLVFAIACILALDKEYWKIKSLNHFFCICIFILLANIPYVNIVLLAYLLLVKETFNGHE